MEKVVPVMRGVAEIEQNRERLASLGTMAAGLAHELNNPAAAARRAAGQLTEALDAINSALAHFVEAGIERSEAEQLVALKQQASDHAASASALGALDAADAEDELLARLEALGIEEPWRLAEPLAVAGVDQAWLDRVVELAGPATDSALRWVAASLTAGRLAAELQESTERMSSLVGAVKSYAYMDRGELVEVDLHEGLETTLTVLGFKLKQTTIAIVRDYDRDLPKLTVRGSELNQVWTNLLDNAIGALGEQGTITITTHADGECAVVEISDDGPGHPRRRGRADLRPVLHDQGGRRRHRPRPCHGEADRGRPPQRLAHLRLTNPAARPSACGFPSPKPDERGAMAACTHLDTVHVTQLPEAVDGCEDCLRMGSPWLHLRICLECGKVGCCDDSPNRHATAHSHASGHPIIRSLEPGEDWSWCYIDEVAMRIPEVHGETRIPPSPLGG